LVSTPRRRHADYARKDFQKYWPESDLRSRPRGSYSGHHQRSPGPAGGWQKTIGDQKDRDLLFVDAILKTLHEEFRLMTNAFTSLATPTAVALLISWSSLDRISLAAFAPSAAGLCCAS